MATRASSAAGRRNFPVAVLRAHVTELEEAVARVLARPKKDAVHDLRKATRRIEAQLALMAELARQEAGFAAIDKPGRKVGKLLKKVRRAAGEVRDLDVERALTKEIVAKGASRKAAQGAKALRQEFKGDRDRAADELVRLLKDCTLDLEARVERLMNALEPMEKVGVPAKDVEALTRAWYAKRRAKAEEQARSAEQLHGVRKAAKLARYMMEGSAAERVATEFETIQEAGGEWHDALTLRDLARDRLGRHSDLSQTLTEREDTARSRFRTMLAS